MLQEIEEVKAQAAFYGELVADESDAGVRNLYIELLNAAHDKFFQLKALHEQMWSLELAR